MPTNEYQGCGVGHVGWRRAALIGALVWFAPALAQAGAARPDPLADEAGCDHYWGQPIGANDPTQRFELILCTKATGVTAKVQTSSLRSGWSVRESVGSWDAAGRELTLKDIRFVESRPELGWRFCLIDALVLHETDEGLAGTYVAEACDDRATLELVKLAPGAPRPTEIELPPADRGAPPGPTPQPVPGSAKQPPADRPNSSSEPSGCACTAAGFGGGHQPNDRLGALGLVLIFGMAGAREHAGARSRRE